MSICQGCGELRIVRFGYCSRRCYDGPRPSPLWMAWRNLRYGNLRYAWWDLKAWVHHVCQQGPKKEK